MSMRREALIGQYANFSPEINPWQALYDRTGLEFALWAKRIMDVPMHAHGIRLMEAVTGVKILPTSAPVNTVRQVMEAAAPLKVEKAQPGDVAVHNRGLAFVTAVDGKSGALTAYTFNTSTFDRFIFPKGSYGKISLVPDDVIFAFSPHDVVAEETMASG